MHLLSGPRRLALLFATFAVLTLTLTLPGTPASAQKDQPQCSDGVDNDSDNSIDGDDAGCAGGSDDDETDSPYSGITLVTIPLPLVTLKGTVDAKGTVDVDKFEIRALRGTEVRVRCQGKACPVKKSSNLMITSRLRLKRLEGKLKPPMVITIKAARSDELGKYVRYEIRRNKSPVREDACLDQDSGKVRPCYVG